MNAKAITRYVLLGVIAIAVGSWAMKEFGPAKAIATGGNDPKAAAASVVRPDGVTVISFHGEKRCKTCIKISELAKQTIDKEFADAEKAGKLYWEQIDYDATGNRHFVKDYELVSSTVVVTQWKDGKEIKWNRLDAVWDHVGDEPVFRAYLAEHVKNLLAGR
jgi:hypothetical protein